MDEEREWRPGRMAVDARESDGKKERERVCRACDDGGAEPRTVAFGSFAMGLG